MLTEVSIVSSEALRTITFALLVFDTFVLKPSESLAYLFA